MKILAIETSTLTGGVAVLSDHTLCAERTLSVSVQHSEKLMPAIERVLIDAGVSLDAIDLIAVAIGPGSFTGLRIGIAAAQGLALSCDKPLVGVSTLEALALQTRSFVGIVATALNAYRGEVYRGYFRLKEGWPVPVKQEAVLSLKDWEEEIKTLGEPVLVIRGDDLLSQPRALPVAWLGQKKFLDNGSKTRAILPAYLRMPG